MSNTFTTITIPSIPDYIKDIAALISGYGWIAGGAVRALYENETPVDVDIFSRNALSHATIKASLSAAGYEPVFSNGMLARYKRQLGDRTLSVDVVVPRTAQYMTTEGNIESILGSFDFTVARAALLTSLLSNPTLLVDTDFTKDVKDKRLVIKNIVCPLGAVKRIAKYTAKGYKISLQEILKLFVAYRERQMDELENLLGRADLSQDELARLLQLVYID